MERSATRGIVFGEPINPVSGVTEATRPRVSWIFEPVVADTIRWLRFGSDGYGFDRPSADMNISVAPVGGLWRTGDQSDPGLRYAASGATFHRPPLGANDVRDRDPRIALRCIRGYIPIPLQGLIEK